MLTSITTGFGIVGRLRGRVTCDYAEYVRNFICIGTRAIRAIVERAIDDQLLYREPIVQLDPSGRPGLPFVLQRPP